MELPEEEARGMPAWVMTFADLMSLLMCFFVLLLSFSEIDAQRFKQIAGELAKAFGVQREVPALEVPLGTSPVFDKFSPGKPEPTEVQEIRQQATTQDPQLDTLRGDAEAELLARAEAQVDQQVRESVAALQQLLQSELSEGRLQLLEERRRIILRVEERGSFASGSAELTPAFEDMLLGMSELLVEIPGTLTVEGHTDDVPISTARFRSNWDLSAARASAVANALLLNPALEPQRLEVKGFADTRPRVANDSAQQRALNRRVEIIIDQSASDEDQAEQLRSLMGDQLRHEVETQRH